MFFLKMLTPLFAFSLLFSGCDGCTFSDVTDAGPAETDGGTSPTGNGLNLNNASVRSCQVLFTTNGDEVPSVRFDDAVRGEFIPKAPRFSLAFAAKEDASLVGIELARFVFEGNAVAPSLTKSTCFDASGTEVLNALQLSN